MAKSSETRAAPEVQRSASQIMFGHLPEQTVDINRGVWRVIRWRDPRIERGVDVDALQTEVLKQAKPWSELGRDGGLAARLSRGHRKLKVLSLARDRGIEAEPFPKLWLCPRCKRLHRTSAGGCNCGFNGPRDQIHFVCYCSDCGTLLEPPIQRCQIHGDPRIRFPGTMAADQIVQECPQCNRILRRGFAGRQCPTCRQPMMAQVHRSASVYSARSVVIVNPPDRVQLERIEAAGGADRALAWVLQGLRARWMDKTLPSPESLRRTLADQGLSPDLIDAWVAQAIARGDVGVDTTTDIPATMRELCTQEAKHIAVALASSRKTLGDLRATAPAGLRQIYAEAYPPQLAAAGLEAVDFVDRFPVLTGSFGYTRGPSNDPTRSVLVPFTDAASDYVVFGEVNETEALFFRLDPLRVARWLQQQGAQLSGFEDPPAARVAILKAVGNDPTGVLEVQLTKLVHSFAHRIIRTAAVHTGVERTSLSEFLVPHHLGFFVYAATRGEFIMGGLQAVYEGELHLLLRDFVGGEHRCPLDPGCASHGGACMACLHLGEPSCRLFNRYLDRAILFAPGGYLDLGP